MFSGPELRFSNQLPSNHYYHHLSYLRLHKKYCDMVREHGQIGFTTMHHSSSPKNAISAFCDIALRVKLLLVIRAEGHKQRSSS